MGGGSSKQSDEKKAPLPVGSYPRNPAQGTSGMAQQHSNVPGAPPAYASEAPPPSTGTFDFNAPPPYQQQQQTIITADAFEAGARFNAGSTRHVPPPPPGAAPNAAQMAAAQGHQVVVGQRNQTLMGGTGDAGAVVW